MFQTYESVCYVTKGSESYTIMKELDWGRGEILFLLSIPGIMSNQGLIKKVGNIVMFLEGIALIDVPKMFPALAIYNTWVLA